MRNNGTKFRQLATQKPRIVQRLFETYGFKTIILSDTDTVWLRDPSGGHVQLESSPESVNGSRCSLQMTWLSVDLQALACRVHREASPGRCAHFDGLCVTRGGHVHGACMMPVSE